MKKLIVAVMVLSINTAVFAKDKDDKKTDDMPSIDCAALFKNEGRFTAKAVFTESKDSASSKSISAVSAK